VTNAFALGAVLHWDEFDKDRPVGTEIKSKFLIVLSAKQGQQCLMVLATKQKHHKKFKPGCSASENYYFIPGVAKEFFREDTWLLLDEPKTATASELVAGGIKGKIKVVYNLREDLLRAIVNCLKQTLDISEHHLSLL
jgi:hypothetical protein